MLLSADLIMILTFFLFLLALAHYFERNDEFLFLPVLFFSATGIMRFMAVTEGRTQWAKVAYAVDIFNLTNELGEQALNYFFWGTATFVLAYYFLSHNMSERKVVYDSPQLFKEFLQKNKKRIIYLFVAVLVITTFANRVISAQQGGFAYGMSYFYLFQLAIGGMILLMYSVFDMASWRTSMNDKIIYGASVAFAAFASYNPNLRFQFLSWMVALVIFWGKGRGPQFKIKYYLSGGIAAVLVFSMAGNSRHAHFNPLSFEEKVGVALYRIYIAEDLNMLDGMMMVLQVYPNHLEYHYGMEHMEILMRPIPRAIWPGKPVGGYANKLGLNDNMDTATVGISQTIFGSFYGEGGVVGIIVFSFLYAMGFVRLFMYTFRFHSPMRFLLKGLAIASWVPLLRGGDLPGIYAFIGMSFWPVFLFHWQYKRFLKQKKLMKTQTAKAESVRALTL